ncbi:galactosylceramide sulfotransferase-like [Amphiura filiformis]|uniref:galactosylceramide sulfotransferase-like n=1 Tax=Amphiura filiformis TaxID=82378 RepID=UPI003B222F80
MVKKPCEVRNGTVTISIGPVPWDMVSAGSSKTHTMGTLVEREQKSPSSVKAWGMGLKYRYLERGSNELPQITAAGSQWAAKCEYVFIVRINQVSIPPPRQDSKNRTFGHHNHSNQCKPRDQLVFIKTHKTGSTTLQNIITKILPPLRVSHGDYDKYANQFDMSTIHFKYNRTFFNTVMKNDTKYISVLRDPVKQFESAFVFFGHGKNGNLSREFDLMLITEYFDESLLLLRKLMCWSFDDILYIKQNARTNASHSQPLSQLVKDKIRQWNVADTDLYEYFNQTLWKKIAAYEPSFHRDLQYFK